MACSIILFDFVHSYEHKYKVFFNIAEAGNKFEEWFILPPYDLK